MGRQPKGNYFMRKEIVIFVGLMCMLLLIVFAEAKNTYKEYTLFNAYTKNTYLIDMDGEVVHTWPCDVEVSYVSYMLQNGTILRSVFDSSTVLNCSGKGGVFQKVDWEGNVIWEFIYHSSKHQPHHDIHPMPNGNVLFIAYEVKSKNDAIKAGRDSSTIRNDLWPDYIGEIEPIGKTDGKIVWEWHFWDHIIQDFDQSKDNYGVVKDHPELLDVNCGTSSGTASSDWLHCNGLDYSPELDQIVISSHFQHELYVIDHSTSIEEAKSHSGGRYGKGGDILYRWGNPENYNRGSSSDRAFFSVHDAHFVPKDLTDVVKIMAFNNGNRRPDGSYSSIDVIEPKIDANGNYIIDNNSPFGPSEPDWSYSNNPDFFTNHLGSAQHLPNGNTFICESTKEHFFEIDSTGKVVWEYNLDISGTKQPQQAHRYTEAQVGIAQKIINEKKKIVLRNYPNPFNSNTKICFDNYKKNAQVRFFSLNGKEIFKKKVKQDYFKWDAKGLSSGVYIVNVNIDGRIFSKYIHKL